MRSYCMLTVQSFWRNSSTGTWNTNSLWRTDTLLSASHPSAGTIRRGSHPPSIYSSTVQLNWIGVLHIVQNLCNRFLEFFHSKIITKIIYHAKTCLWCDMKCLIKGSTFGINSIEMCHYLFKGRIYQTKWKQWVTPVVQDSGTGKWRPQEKLYTCFA